MIIKAPKVAGFIVLVTSRIFSKCLDPRNPYRLLLENV